MTTATVRAIPNTFTWRVLIGCGIATIALGIAKGFTVDPRSPIIGSGLIILMLSLAHFYSVYRPRPQFAYPMSLVGYFLASALVFGPMSYFMQSLNLPMLDAEFAQFDRALGIDWPALYQYVTTRETLASVSYYIYATSGAQMLVAWAVLGCTGQITRLSVFLTALTVATAVVIVIAGLLPATGAYPFYGVIGTDSGFLAKAGPGASYLGDLYGLRDGTLRAIDLSKLEGIITLPSFHTVVAVLSGWALINMRWIGRPFAAYAAYVVFTTLPIGGHHFIDVLAGAVIAVASIAIGWRVETVRPAVAGTSDGGLQPEAAATAV